MSILVNKVRSIALWSSGRRLMVTVPCFVFLLWLISFSPWWFSEASIKADHGIGTLDLQFARSAAEAQATLVQLGASGRRAYDTFQIVDIFFPTSYAVALSGLIWTLWRGARHRWVVYLAAVPMLGAALDYAENVLVRIALSSYPSTSRAELTVASVVTTAKLILSYGAQAAVVVGLVVALTRRLRARSRSHLSPVDSSDASDEVEGRD